MNYILRLNLKTTLGSQKNGGWEGHNKPGGGIRTLIRDRE